MIISLPQAVKDMDAPVQRLKDVKDDINGDLDRKQRSAKIIVQNWLDKAGSAVQSSESISNEYQQHKNCLGCCPNCFCRYRISKRIRDWKRIVAQLHSNRQSDFPHRGEYREPTLRIQIPIQNPKFIGEGIQAARSKLERWLSEDTDIRVIGIYGVGKTWLLQTINNSHKVSESFELIIWLTVSKVYGPLNLQDCISNRSQLTLPNRSDLEWRKYELCSSLKDEKIPLILDDIGENFNLERLGVSLNDTGSKIVLSTQSKGLCTEMDANDKLPVKSLLEEEGWQLFCKGAFRNRNVPQEIDDVARKIAGECKGLPLAIYVVAAAMRKYTGRRPWERELALKKMQTVGQTFFEKNLFQPLKWSYHVPPDYVNTYFVYFAAYQVINIWIAEGLVTGSEDFVGRMERVKMHDGLHESTIQLRRRSIGVILKPGRG